MTETSTLIIGLIFFFGLVTFFLNIFDNDRDW